MKKRLLSIITAILILIVPSVLGAVEWDGTVQSYENETFDSPDGLNNFYTTCSLSGDGVGVCDNDNELLYWIKELPDPQTNGNLTCEWDYYLDSTSDSGGYYGAGFGFTNDTSTIPNMWSINYGQVGTQIGWRDNQVGTFYDTGMVVNTWYRVKVVVGKGSSQPMSWIYVDGVQVASDEVGGSVSGTIFFRKGYSGNRVNDQYDNLSCYNGTVWTDPTPPVPVLEITAQDAGDLSSITSFTAWVVNGSISYENSTTTGTLTYGDITSGLYNITVGSTDYFNSTYNNWNWSIDLTANLTKYPLVAVYNNWTGGNLTGFNITVNGTLYEVSGSSDYLPIVGVGNVTLNATGYIQRNFIHDFSNDLNTSMWQSVVTVQAEEISTLNSITGFDIQTTQGYFGDESGTVTMYPNTGSYSWGIGFYQYYFNTSGLSFTVSSTSHSFTVENNYARDLYFYNNKSILSSLTPTCVQDGYSYSAYSYHIHNSTSEMTCNLFGYDPRTLNLSSTPENGTYYLEPVAFHLDFTQLVEGLVETSTEVFSFNATNVTLQQVNLSTGYVTVTFNKDGSDKYQQVFKYYNDLNTTIKDEILVQDVDLVQQIKVTGNKQAIGNARVCAQMAHDDEWKTTYCDYTDSTGFVNILVNDQNTYQFCAQADGFTSSCEIAYIPPSNEDTIIIEMTSTTSQSGTNLISSTCAPTLNSNETCALSVITYKPFSSICVNVSNGDDDTVTCSADSISETFLYDIYSNYTQYELTVYLEAIETSKLYHGSGTEEPTADVKFDSGNNDGSSIIDRVKENIVLYIALHIFMIAIAILSYYIMERYFNGYGVYGAGLWFLFMGIAGLYVFYIPAVIIITHFITEKLLPLFQH